MTGDVTVPAGVTLTIDPGVQVTFASTDSTGSGASTTKVELIVSGTLNAQGTTASPITLTATNAYGVRVLGGATATFDSVNLTGGTYGVDSFGSTTFTNSIVQGPSSAVCVKVGNGTLSFSNGTIQSCTQAVSTLGGSVSLSYSVVRSSGNFGNGFYALTFSGPTTLIHNTITGNIYGAIKVNSFTGNANIYDNIITANDLYGISFASTSFPTRAVHHNDVWDHESADYSGVTEGTGSISTNPLFVSSSNFHITEYSPARLMASDGTDLGAFAYAGDPATSLQGVLVADKTLTGANTVAGDLTVRPGVTLTLASGASLTFASTDGMGSGTEPTKVEIIVEGNLNAQGTSASPVTVTATNGVGISVNGSATLDYATIQGGSACLLVNSGTASFTHGLIQNCAFGLYTFGGTTTLAYSVVRNSGSSANSYYAVTVSAPTNLIHNTLTGNPYGAIKVYSFTGNANIYDNIITSNSLYGISFTNTSSPTRAVHHNDVWSHSSSNYSGVTAGTGSFSANPLFVSSSNFHITEYSPARLTASDGTDLGAFAYAGDLSTSLQGAIVADKTLTGANTLTGDVTVRPGATLTLAPGATLTFASTDGMVSGSDTTKVELIIDGNLNVQGTSASPVTINATNGIGTNVTGSATFNYATLNGGRECLRVTSGTTAFTQGTIQNCTMALNTLGGSTDFTYSVVRNSGSSSNSYYAVEISAPTNLIHNTLTANNYGAVRVYSFTGNANIYDNIVSSNGLYGISFLNTSSPTRAVHHNDVWTHSSSNYSGVTPGTGSFSANPLFVSSSNQHITEYSPARKMASDGTDLGAFAYSGDPAASLQGAIVADLTLTGANTLAGDLTVRPGVTLTLAAGATLTFAASDGLSSGSDTTKVELIVDGNLNVDGSGGAPVTIAATNGIGTNITGSATFNYATLDGGRECLRVTSGTTAFTSGTIQNCTMALNTLGGSTNFLYSVVRNSGSSSNSYYAVEISAPTNLIHNTLTANNYGAVRVYSFTGNANIYDNIVSSNGLYGISFFNTSFPTRAVHHNDVWTHSSSNYSGVSAGPGSFSANPLFVSSSNQHITEYSPARQMASDGTDIGAFGWSGDPATSLQGALVSDLTLSGANTLAGDLTVRPGATLTLAPGATLTFASSDGLGSGQDTAKVELFVDGTLDVQGTSASPVTLTATNGYGTIINGSATFNYATLDGGFECLRVDGGTTSFTHGIIQNCTEAVGTTGGSTNVSYSLVRNSGSSSNSFFAVETGAPITLSHNTFANNNYGAVRVYSFTGTANIYDNIVSSNGLYGIYFTNATNPTRVVHHNDVWSHASADYTGVSAGTGSISSNPLFVSSTNFTLQETSPCRNVASDGTDMGAYPYVPVHVAYITVTPTPVTLAVQGTKQFNATAYDSSNNPLPWAITWSAASAAGSVNSSGLFTAGCTPGTYTGAVTASADGKSASADVTLTAGAASAVAVSPSSASVPINGTQQFTASVTDACNNSLPTAPVTWVVTSGGGSINSSGLFTAGNTVGTFNNTVRAFSGTLFGTASVTVTGGALASIEVTPNNTTLGVNGTQQFTATGKDSAGNIVPVTATWSVVNGGGAINSTGLFTAGATTGTFTNTVKATSGTVSGFASVTVQPGTLASIEVAPVTTTLPINGTQQFTATGKDSAGNTISVSVTWSVVNSGGSINSTGLFTAGTTPGTYASTIKATSSGISGFASVMVQPGALASIEVTPNTATLPINGQQQFTATGKDSAGNTVSASITWSVANGGGSIDGTGLFTAGTAPGTFTNTVKATSGAISGFASVTVQPGGVASVELTPVTATLAVRGTQQFTATAKDSSGNTVSTSITWSVVNGGGTIDSTGLFTAGTVAGTFSQTVKASSGSVSATASVTVNPGALQTVAVAPASVTLSVGGAQQFTAQGQDADGNIVSITPVWSVVNGAGSITADGLFTATQTPGSYLNSVVATANGVTGTASITVAAGGIQRVVISPENPTVAVNGTITFTAKAFDAFDNEITGLTPTWEVAAGGTIDSSGVFTAGTLRGTFVNVIKVTMGDKSATTSVTISTDVDGDGLPDAWEVANGLDPTQPGDGTLDPDGDKLSNLSEFQAGTDPHDADTDDDGVLDGNEQGPGQDSDGDGLVNARDPDSDNDGLFDGTEMAISTPHANTDTSKGKFIADADPTTSTASLLADTDGDGRKDGEEDVNYNGKIDPGETDPNHADTFCSATPECGSGQVCESGVCVADPSGPDDGNGGGCNTSGAGASMLGLVLISLLGRVGARRRKA